MVAPYVVDFKLDFNTLMLGLLNNDNGKALTSSQVEFGTVSTNDGVNNSKVTVTAIGDNPNKGTTVITYNRVDMNTLNVLPFEHETSGDYLTFAELLPLINLHYGLELTVDDIVDANLPVPEQGAQEVVALPIKSTHGVWLNGCNVTITKAAE